MLLCSGRGLSRQIFKGRSPVQVSSIYTAKELRGQFLQYFASKNHTIVPGSSVIPKDDPSLLFVNAGMNQFKKYYLGQAVPYKVLFSC